MTKENKFGKMITKTAIWLFGIIKSLIAGRETGRLTIDLFEGGIGKVYFKKEIKPIDN